MTPKLMLDRERAGHKAPLATVVDSQKVKVRHAKTQGYHARRVFGRERRIAVDTDGRLLMVKGRRPTSPTAPSLKPFASAGRG